MPKLLKISALLLLVVAIVRCNNCDPISDPGNFVVLQFLDSAEKIIVLDSTRFSAVQGVGNDSVLYDTTFFATTPQLLPLPLSKLTDTVGFAFSYPDTTLTDTLFLFYEQYIAINGPDCDAFEEFRNLQIDTARTTFKRVELLDGLVQPQEELINLQIFFPQ